MCAHVRASLQLAAAAIVAGGAAAVVARGGLVGGEVALLVPVAPRVEAPEHGRGDVVRLAARLAHQVDRLEGLDPVHAVLPVLRLQVPRAPAPLCTAARQQSRLVSLLFFLYTSWQ